ncbi:MAG: thiolase family protein, partial [Betaproteobacteria bacterium]|nr:thiolase family protein [Betaproteobacteria bacterium]
VQRACGSAQSGPSHFAANLIATGVCDVVIAAGVESMSRTAGAADDPKYGRRYPEALQQRFSLPTMGIAAERIAHRWNLSREYLDELSLRSHQLADRAWQAGRFDSQLHPIAQPDGTVFRTDEGVRPATTMEKLAALKPAFQDDGRVTAGNSSQISDGAAAILLMSRAKAAEYGLRPRARIHTQTVVGVDPEIMLTGPIPATRPPVLARAGPALHDIDLFEINEAFASVLGSWLVETGADPERVNVNGGSIAIGHPLGSTGAADDDPAQRAGAAGRAPRVAVDVLRGRPGH